MPSDGLVEFLECYPGLAFIADADGTVRRVSRALTQRFGDRFAVDATLGSLVVPDDREVVAGFLRELAEAEGPVTCTVRLQLDAVVRCVARRASSGSICAQLEPVVTEDQARVERALFRTLLDTLDIVMWAIEPSGKFVFHDGKALATAGLQRGQFLGLNVFDLYPPELVTPIRAALQGSTSQYESEAHGVHWRTWNAPVESDSGRVDYCVGLTLDVSAAVETELELKRQIETIRRQQRAIHELSAPLLRVWDDVLTVPLIGTMDNERIDDITDRLLAEANRSRTRFAILDLTGVETLDTAIANRVLQLLASLRLLGVEGMISGISPHVALTMVGLGIELEAVRTLRSLREALHYCMLQLRKSS